MVKCVDCNTESESSSEWYAQLFPEGKLMRCPDCGEKEKNASYQNYYGKRFIPTEEVNKQDRISHAKKLRDIGLSPWKFHQV